MAAALLLASCATRADPGAQPSGAGQARSSADPFEPLDRTADGVGRQLRRATPGPVRRGLHNLLQNLNEPVVAMNDGLQGRPGAGGRTLVRFVINSTLGLAGLFDQARKAGLPHHDNGFGLTLGRYGVPDGPRFRLPLLGPFTVREAVGEVVDFVTDPVGLVPFHGAQRVNIARTALELVYDPEDVETQDQGATPPPALDASASELPPY